MPVSAGCSDTASSCQQHMTSPFFPLLVAAHPLCLSQSEQENAQHQDVIPAYTAGQEILPEHYNSVPCIIFGKKHSGSTFSNNTSSLLRDFKKIRAASSGYLLHLMKVVWVKSHQTTIKGNKNIYPERL